MRNHKKLRAFQVADEVAIATYHLTAQFPKSELYGLVQNMRRTAVSTPSNIVEGCARTSQAELVRFLEIAFGSAERLEYLVDLAKRLRMTNPSQISNLGQLCDRNCRILNALICSFRDKSD
jgi:four helix bundle protein